MLALGKSAKAFLYKLTAERRPRDKAPGCPAGVGLLTYAISTAADSLPPCTIVKEQLPQKLGDTGLTLAFLHMGEMTDDAFLLVQSDAGDPLQCRFAGSEQATECTRTKLREDCTVQYGDYTVAFRLLPAWTEHLSRTQLPRLHITVSPKKKQSTRAVRTQPTVHPVTVTFEPSACRETFTIGTNGDFDLKLYAFFGAGDVYCTVLFDPASRAYIFLQPSGKFLVQTNKELTAARPTGGAYSSLYAGRRRQVKVQSVVAVDAGGETPGEAHFDIGQYYHFDAVTEPKPRFCALGDGGEPV